MTLPQYLDLTKTTQASFADRLGVAQGTISKLCNERNPRRPSWGMAARIEKETGGAVPVSVWANVATLPSGAA